jgi:acyl carrier protein
MKTRAEAVEAIAKAIEMPSGSLVEGARLSEIPEWDSMSVLVFITMADSSFGKQIKADQLSACQTVGELVDLLLA